MARGILTQNVPPQVGLLVSTSPGKMPWVLGDPPRVSGDSPLHCPPCSGHESRCGLHREKPERPLQAPCPSAGMSSGGARGDPARTGGGPCLPEQLPLGWGSLSSQSPLLPVSLPQDRGGLLPSFPAQVSPHLVSSQHPLGTASVVLGHTCWWRVLKDRPALAVCHL